MVLTYIWIAIPCKFWIICHHATYLCIRYSYMLLCVLLSYCHLCALLSPASVGKSATIPPTHLLSSLIRYDLMCGLLYLASLGKTCHHATYLLVSLICCPVSFYPVSLSVNCYLLQDLENLPPCHLTIS